MKVLGAPESSSEAWEGQDLRFVTAAAAATMLLVALRPASGSLTRAKAAWPAAALSALCLAVRCDDPRHGWLGAQLPRCTTAAQTRPYLVFAA